MSMPRPLELDVGIRLRLWEHPGEGPVVLFLHGYLDTGRSYDDVVAALGGRVRALCLDWRGHGESGRVGPGGSYHLLDHLKDLAALMQAFRDEDSAPDLVVAHSMGGNVALMLAGALPDEVGNLLLLDALGPPAEAPEEQPARLGRVITTNRSAAKPFSAFETREAAMERLRALNHGLSAAGAERMVRHALSEEADGWRFPFDPRLRGPTPVRYPEEMWTALCGRIAARVRLIRAEHGYVPEGEPATTRIAAMAQATMETWVGVGHHLHVEAPERVAQTVLDTLAQAPS